MADAVWLSRRLKAMSTKEMLWRISQKVLQQKEKYKFSGKRIPVTEYVFNARLEKLNLSWERLHINYKNKNFSCSTQIPLLGNYEYEDYKDNWNFGFQTDNCWPDVFSSSLNYKQRDDIGDARTNWELNRHFQFAILAKNYMATGNKDYLEELQALFFDWNKKNPFLRGISWTSVMEIAIRTSNWCYVYCFLSQRVDASEQLMIQLRNGILNMTDYITNHFSRYSSANNHLIVEAYAIGQSGILFNHQPWIDSAISILTKELSRQNYADGINKELSLHYQSFYMEAMGLFMRLLVKNSLPVPDSWKPMLEKMCGYLADCTGKYGEVVEFGDNDEGKILDLQGGIHHYQYVQKLFGFLLDKRYINIKEESDCENLQWLFTEKDYHWMQTKPVETHLKSVCYPMGGVSVLKSTDKKVLIGIDHGALGFGSIAVHGHADALSFQMFANGIPIFIDPGTYIYHCDIKHRNSFRMTKNHNTVCINGQDQSEMSGAFLWGRKAVARLLEYDFEGAWEFLEAEHNGYMPVAVKRRFRFNKTDTLEIVDRIDGKSNVRIPFFLGKQTEIRIDRDSRTVVFSIDDIQVIMVIALMGQWKDFEIKKSLEEFSDRYGVLKTTSSVICSLQCQNETTITTTIFLKMADGEGGEKNETESIDYRRESSCTF